MLLRWCNKKGIILFQGETHGRVSQHGRMALSFVN